MKIKKHLFEPAFCMVRNEFMININDTISLSPHVTLMNIYRPALLYWKWDKLCRCFNWEHAQQTLFNEGFFFSFCKWKLILFLFIRIHHNHKVCEKQNNTYHLQKAIIEKKNIYIILILKASCNIQCLKKTLSKLKWKVSSFTIIPILVTISSINI